MNFILGVPLSSGDIINKSRKVCDSCETLDQARAASKYLELAKINLAAVGSNKSGYIVECWRAFKKIRKDHEKRFGLLGSDTIARKIDDKKIRYPKVFV